MVAAVHSLSGRWGWGDVGGEGEVWFVSVWWWGTRSLRTFSSRGAKVGKVKVPGRARWSGDTAVTQMSGSGSTSSHKGPNLSHWTDEPITWWREEREKSSGLNIHICSIQTYRNRGHMNYNLEEFSNSKVSGKRIWNFSTPHFGANKLSNIFF